MSSNLNDEPEHSRQTGMLSPKQREARREFMRTILAAVIGVAGISVLGYVPVYTRWQLRLRPPGAQSEDDFLASCIKCGQCVQICPVNAITLADITDGYGVGTPYISAREQTCDFSCDGLQCVLACPTGALTHEIRYPHQVSIGVARLDRPDQCLAMQGKGFKGQARGPDFTGLLRYEEIDRWNPLPVREHPYDLALCDLCVRQCPIEIRIKQCESGNSPAGDKNQCPPQHAITLELVADGNGVQMKPVVHDGCVGCGTCEMICPVTPAAIVVDIGQKAFMA